MKNTIKFFGIIALVAVIGFSMAACGGGGGGGDGGGGSSTFGDTLTLSNEQVHIAKMNIKAYTSGSGSLYTYEPYKGSVKTFTSTVGGKGSITDGKLNFTVGAPPAGMLEPIKTGDDVLGLGGDFEGDIYKDLKVTPKGTKCVGLEFDDPDLMKMKQDLQIKDTSFSVKVEMVLYVYVDQDCTITGTGGTATQSSSFGKPYTVKASNINLSLKEGWNVMNVKTDVGYSGTGTMSIKTGNLSSCKWVYDDGSFGFDFD